MLEYTTNVLASIHGKVGRIKEIANASQQAKQYDKALEQYTVAVKLMEAHPGEINAILESELYSNRSYTYFLLNDHEHALQDAESCIAADAKWFKGHVRLGIVYETLGSKMDALKSYVNAMECGVVQVYLQRPCKYKIQQEIVLKTVTIAMELNESNLSDVTQWLQVDAHRSALCSSICLSLLIGLQRFDCLHFLLQQYKSECNIILDFILEVVDRSKWAPMQEECAILCLKNKIPMIELVDVELPQHKHFKENIMMQYATFLATNTGSTALLSYLLRECSRTTEDFRERIEKSHIFDVRLMPASNIIDPHNLKKVLDLLKDILHVDDNWVTNPYDEDSEESRIQRALTGKLYLLMVARQLGDQHLSVAERKAALNVKIQDAFELGTYNNVVKQMKTQIQHAIEQDHD